MISIAADEERLKVKIFFKVFNWKTVCVCVVFCASSERICSLFKNNPVERRRNKQRAENELEYFS